MGSVMIKWLVTALVYMVKPSQKLIERKFKPENKGNLLSELEGLENTSTVSSYKSVVARGLDWIDGKLKKPFAFKSFQFTNTIATLYPLVLIYLSWIFTGENISRINGFSSPVILLKGTYILWEFLDTYTIIRLEILLVSLFIMLRILSPHQSKREYLDINNKFHTYSIGNLFINHYLRFFLVESVPIVVISISIFILNEFIIISMLLFIFIRILNFGGGSVSIEIGGLIAATICSIISSLVIYLAIKQIVSIELNHWFLDAIIFFISYVLTSIVTGVLYFCIFDRFIRIEVIRQYAFAVLFLISSYLIASSLDNPDPNIINIIVTLIVLFFILPSINSIFDYLSINYTRWIVRKSMNKGFWIVSRNFMADLFFALLCLFGLVISFWIGLWIVNIISSGILENYHPINIRDILNTMQNNKWDGSLWWIYITLFSTLLPTVIHLIIAVSRIFILHPKKVLGRKYEGMKNDIDECRIILKSPDIDFTNKKLRKTFLKLTRIKVTSYFVAGLLTLTFFIIFLVSFLNYIVLWLGSIHFFQLLM